MKNSPKITVLPSVSREEVLKADPSLKWGRRTYHRGKVPKTATLAAEDGGNR